MILLINKMSYRTITYIVLLVFLCLLVMSAGSQKTDYESRMKRWREARFGMFIHWGPVSLTGHEIGWSRGRQTPVEEYDQLYKKFNPVKFNAEEWASVARDAGMKYMVITTKHHDGFCLWPSKYTDYHIGNTPFKRDVLKELSLACRKNKIAFGTYYSVCDWYHPDYPMGSPGGKTKKPNPNLDRYIEYLRNQSTELIKAYGPLWVMWFDVPREVGPEHGKPTIKMLRKLQPSLVVNNRAYLRAGKKKGAGKQEYVGDYSTPEQRVGGFNCERPWETCMTICRQWAWKPGDTMKSLKQCIQILVKTVGGDGNLLFNVGPMPDGRIEPRQVQRLKEMGQWLKKYKESIFSTRGGPFMPNRNIASTCRKNKIYLHILNGKKEILLPKINFNIKKATMLTSGKVKLLKNDKQISVILSEDAVNEIDAIVILETDIPAEKIEPVKIADRIKIRASNVYRKKIHMYGPEKVLDNDLSTRWATDKRVKKAWIEISYLKEIKISCLRIKEISFPRIRKFIFQYDKNNSWTTCYEGTTAGPDFKTIFKEVKSKKFRLQILDSEGGPTIEEIILE